MFWGERLIQSFSDMRGKIKQSSRDTLFDMLGYATIFRRKSARVFNAGQKKEEIGVMDDNCRS